MLQLACGSNINTFFIHFLLCTIGDLEAERQHQLLDDYEEQFYEKAQPNRNDNCEPLTPGFVCVGFSPFHF